MPNPTRSLLAALMATTVVVSAALVWGGLRLIDQQQALDQQAAQRQAESTADAIAASIRGKLAESGERLSAWVSNPTTPVPVIDGAVVVGVRAAAVDVSPAGGVPFVPIDIQPPRTDEVFAPLEAAEFQGDANRARRGYAALADHRDAAVRAGALLRLARASRQLRDLDSALAAYQRLEQFGDVRIGDLPAELAGLVGQRSLHGALTDDHAGRISERIRRGLDEGRWILGRGAAELYRDAFSEPRPQSWIFANALSEVWRDARGQVTSRGQRVFTDAGFDPRVLVVWRSNGTVTAAFAAPIDNFLDLPTSASTAWQLVDPEGRVIGGRDAGAGPPLGRIIGSSDYPWTLHTWVDPGTVATRGDVIPAAMMAAMLAFIWASAFFMAKAIRREAAAARLQSDFVAAVSHEFRSPLTAVRQLAEMLLDNRVTSDERRHTYYTTLAAEAARLQRLIETLLDFGKVEAGGSYSFSELNAAALVRGVVDDIAPQARHSGTAIAVDGADDAIVIRADSRALAVALRNVIDNAIKYSPGQPIVRVQCRRDGDRAAICVIDRGVGIPRSEQHAIFGKFVRGRTAIDANIKGTGVGLAIVHQIVTAHGGEIVLQSEPGTGSTFTLLLPVAN